MNENQPPLEIHPDEHLEARITAYVLGESSPFEAAEIEALIEKSPELKLFANRTRTLSKLLKEAETTSNSPDSEWKLSADKRAALAPHLGPVPVLVPQRGDRENRIRRASFRAAIGIAACFVVTLIISRLYVLPKFEVESAMLASSAEERGKADSKQIPTAQPEKSLTEPSANFGDGEDFGRGWGGGGSGAISKESALLSRVEATPEDQPAQIEDPGVVAQAIHIGGQVRKPGALELESQMKLGDAVRAAGGGTEFGSERRVRLFRNGQVTSHDLRDQDLANVQLQEGDVIEVPQKNWFGAGISEAKNSKEDVIRQIASAAQLEASEPSAKPAPRIAQADPFADGETDDEQALTERNAKVAPEQSGSLLKDERMLTRDSLDTLQIAGDTLPVPPEEPTKELNGSERAERESLQEAKPKTEEFRFRRELADLEAPTRTNPATTFQHSAIVDEAWKLEASANREDFSVDPFAETSSKGAPNANQPISEADNRADVRKQAETIPKSEAGRGPGYDWSFGEETTNGATGGFAGKVQDRPTDDAIGINLGVDVEPFLVSPATPTGSDTRNNGESTEINGIREFVYPTEYDPPEIASLSGVFDTDSNIPVTPATPTAFESKNSGVDLEVDGLEGADAPLLGELPVLGRLFKQPAIDLADLSQEIPANLEPFSTFSLNISDASFQLARSAIEKGERPDPESIKPEQFYNAVDYGDPAPSSLEPVAAAIDQTAHPVIPGRNLVRVGIRTASTGRSAAQPLRLTLLVDQSGSMVRNDRRAAMEKALEQLATLLTETDEITVIGFSRTPRLLADSMKGDKAGKLPDLVNQTANEGGTNIEQAINLASDLALRHKLDGAQNRIVLFTDGAANLGNADPDRLAEKIKHLRQQGLAFDIAGIGTNELNDNLLSELARHGNGRYYLVGENTGASFAAKLAGAFRPAAENVKVQVKLNPERVGNYKLIGFEKDRLKTEDFRNDSVDAAELAADEAGVAMYQVETLPEGSGEIGEVSVRFRDTASGEMVERTWTIPYDATAPAFDKAAPKTQLATLSLLAAQKLQGGPLADAISFGNYAKTIAELRQTYKADAKAQQMLNLVNALK